jgi:hypothetical protein
MAREYSVVIFSAFGERISTIVTFNLHAIDLTGLVHAVFVIPILVHRPVNPLLNYSSSVWLDGDETIWDG